MAYFVNPLLKEDFQKKTPNGTVDGRLSLKSTNPVQNKTLTKIILDKVTKFHDVMDVIDDQEIAQYQGALNSTYDLTPGYFYINNYNPFTVTETGQAQEPTEFSKQIFLWKTESDLAPFASLLLFSEDPETETEDEENIKRAVWEFDGRNFAALLVKKSIAEGWNLPEYDENYYYMPYGFYDDNGDKVMVEFDPDSQSWFVNCELVADEPTITPSTAFYKTANAGGDCFAVEVCDGFYYTFLTNEDFSTYQVFRNHFALDTAEKVTFEDVSPVESINIKTVTIEANKPFFRVNVQPGGGTPLTAYLERIEKGTVGAYIELTISPVHNHKQSISLNLHYQDIKTADYDHRGVAETWDVKQYVDANNKDKMWYGVYWDKTTGSPDCVRFGNMDLHRSLPVQSQMVGGVMLDDGTFTPFDNPDDWTQATQKRDGTDGQVMVRIPRHWIKFSEDSHYCYVMMSAVDIAGFTEVPEQYIGAYEATVQRSTSKLSSVVNTSTDYRGGNNNANWDGTYRSLLGKPVTTNALGTYRIYARNRGAKWIDFNVPLLSTVILLFVVEYATQNCQKPFNAELTTEGYRQGGLGLGITNWNMSAWQNYNLLLPFCDCGYTDVIGNSTGVRTLSIESVNFLVPRYRGIENLFGHIWKWLDGVLINVTNNISELYLCDDYTKFSDIITSNYYKIGNVPRYEGFIKSVFFPNLFAKNLGASSSSHYCDFFYTNINNKTVHGVRHGATAYHGPNAGLYCIATQDTPMATFNYLGTRLTFKPSN